ncbi:MAG: hypothetical protein M1825_003158 [Sarcosagium campestre]|nr:MAG: hypothetical protein M1825_003158 [Sarcosagium campestre]
MLLILCDLFRAVWFTAVSALYLKRSNAADESTFCLVSGFFIALGTEASDFATFTIALHTAVYVFRPPHASAEGGIFPYRFIVYALWVGFAATTASLAFVNPEQAYVYSGAFCKLPVRPFWYRLALSWIPRYVIVCTIFGLYVGIYIHVQWKYHGIATSLLTSSGGRRAAEQAESRHKGTAMSPRSLARMLSGRRDWPSASAINDPTLPHLNLNGLVEPQSPGIASVGFDQPLVASSRFDPFITRAGCANQSGDGASSSTPNTATRVEIWQRSSFAGPGILKPFASQSSDVSDSEYSRPTFIDPSADGERTSVSYAEDTIRGDQRRSYPRRSPKPKSDSDRGHDFKATKRKIRRQLRLLFIYPTVYLLMWIPSFAAHCLQYSDNYVKHPILALDCLSILFLVSQGTINCCVFLERERPWRYVTMDEVLHVPKLWRSVYRCFGRTAESPTADRRRQQESTKSSMESQLAYRRREAELAEATEMKTLRRLTQRPDSTAVNGGGTEWWERPESNAS